MTHEERNNIAAIITNLLVITIFGRLIWTRYQNGLFDGADGLVAWARTIIWMIPVSVVVTIIVTILFAILYAILTNTPKPSFVVDERDQMIGTWGMKVTMIGVGIGFILSIAALAVGWSTILVFNMILASFALGDLTGNLAKMVLYRRGG